MRLLDLGAIRDKARKLGPFGLIAFLIQTICLELSKDRLASWANKKLDENVAPLLPILVKFMAQHPVKSSFCTLGVCCAAIVLWAFISPPPIHNGWPDLAIGTKKVADGLVVWLENRTTGAMAECTLFLAGLDLFSVDARDFVSKGSFSGVWLIKPQRLRPRSRSKFGYLVELPNATRHFLATPDASDQRLTSCH
jgi:hypothetical protein